MAKYLIRHWVNVDVIAEKVVDESEININNNDLKKNQIPDGTFSYVMVNNSEKINRTTYEIYDEKLKYSSKESSSNK
jgi:DNA gyrase inhibitor GyrI